MPRTMRLIWLTLLVLLLLCNCSRDKEKTAENDKVDSDNSVVAVGDKNLSGEELLAYATARTMQKELDIILDELVTAELLAQEAVRQGIDQKPEIRHAVRQLLGRQLLEEKVDKPILTREITEEELSKYYEEHPELYSRPEQVRVADIFIATQSGDSAQVRHIKKKKAEEILSQAKVLEKERFGFSQLVRDHSDQHPGYRLGDTGFFNRKGLPGKVAPQLVEAGFSLKVPGQLYGQVIATDMGYHIIKLIGRREPLTRELAGVAKEIEQRIRREQLQTYRTNYIASLKEKGEIVIKADLLDQIRSELSKNREQAGLGGEIARKRKPIMP